MRLKGGSPATWKAAAKDLVRRAHGNEVKAEESDKKNARERKDRNEQRAANKFKHQAFCIVCKKADCNATGLDGAGTSCEQQCFEAPELVCVRCPTRMHLDCTPGWSFVTIKQNDKDPMARKQVAGGWICPHHRCKTCWRTAHEAGGLLFRCVDCPSSLCEDCLPDGFEPVPSQKYFGECDNLARRVCILRGCLQLG